MLHLSDTLGNAVIRLERNDTGIVNGDQYGAIEFEGQDINTDASGVRASIRAKATASLGQTALTFSTASNTATESERMRIAPDGSVGIGTDSPSELLHIYNTGGAGNDANVLIEGNGSGVNAKLTIDGHGSGGQLDLTYRSNTQSRTVAMRCLNDGSFKIDTLGLSLIHI